MLSTSVIWEISKLLHNTENYSWKIRLDSGLNWIQPDFWVVSTRYQPSEYCPDQDGSLFKMTENSVCLHFMRLHWFFSRSMMTLTCHTILKLVLLVQASNARSTIKWSNYNRGFETLLFWQCHFFWPSKKIPGTKKLAHNLQ